MRLKISHRTEYRYDVPVQYALQRLRLVPRGGTTQTVLNWALKSKAPARRFATSISSTTTRGWSASPASPTIGVVAWGEVETLDTAGVFGEHQGLCAALALPARDAADAARRRYPRAGGLDRAGPDLDRLHRLMGTIATKVAYRVGATHAGTTAEEALRQGSGVCQDHAHIFVAAARVLGFPARYVSGYLMMNETIDQAATHAWAEAYVEALGWVAFDASNGISP